MERGGCVKPGLNTVVTSTVTLSEILIHPLREGRRDNGDRLRKVTDLTVLVLDDYLPSLS